MNKFLYKTIIIFFFFLTFYHLTIGSKIREFESKIDSLTSKGNVENLKIKIREEMNNAISKEQYLNPSDAKLIKSFLDKLTKELKY
jgi:hypothetical protein